MSQMTYHYKTIPSLDIWYDYSCPAVLRSPLFMEYWGPVSVNSQRTHTAPKHMVVKPVKEFYTFKVNMHLFGSFINMLYIIK